jgi:transcriptional regulator GlxA family with amidase domain
MTAPGLASIYVPGQVPDTTWSEGAAQIVFKVPPTLVEVELEKMLGHSLSGPVGFAPAMDLTRPTGQGLRRLVELVAREFGTETGLLQQPVTRRHIEQLLVDGLLAGQRHDFSDELQRRSHRAAASAVTQAVNLIEEDPAAPWSALSLARRVHVSVRSLQEGFRRDYGTTPMSHVRNVRLRCVREELLEGTAGSLTVQEVAAKWGFLHMGRFAAHYRRAYAELPSTTLRRTSETR